MHSCSVGWQQRTSNEIDLAFWRRLYFFTGFIGQNLPVGAPEGLKLEFVLKKESLNLSLAECLETESNQK